MEEEKASKMDIAPSEPVPSSKFVTLADISKTISYITKGVEINQPRLIQRAIRQNANIRKFVTREQLKETAKKFIMDSCPSSLIMCAVIEKLPVTETVTSESSSSDSMEVEEVKMDSLNLGSETTIPEVEVYIFTLVISTLLREKLDDDAALAATALMERVGLFNRRSLDLLSSKAFFYFSLAFERIQKLENIRPTLLAFYRTACIRHDEMSQAVLFNLLMRNYLNYNLIEQARTLSEKAAFPEGASNNQFCRYLYYLGRIQAIQLEYSEAYQRLLMAARKAPQEWAPGFTRTVYKLTVIVQLLMGEIPERSLFNQVELRAALKPYLHLTHAVRNGDIKQFNGVMTTYEAQFKADQCYTLVKRLGHNVLKTGLRKLSVSYSRISLSDVAEKLHLPSVSSAEYMCAKAIRDGVIEATIDHENSWLVSTEAGDLYSTDEPQKAFHKRIAFCLDVRNEAVKNMHYPPDAYKKELANSSSGKAKEDEKSIEELIREMEEEEGEK